MAIDSETGKRIKLVKTALDIQKEKKEKARPKFDITYEEELKKQLFEEDARKLEKEKITEEIIQEEKLTGHFARPLEEWDVPITEEILYFDPELSYELTGYRPITMEKGLDFDPEPFREMAHIYETTGSYTKFPEGTKPWRDLWNREVDRMQHGYTVGKYRITGDNYYYLNYYRMQTISDSDQAATGRVENFPTFLAKQYEWFHYVEMAEKLGKDVAILKTRGCGLSECVAAMSVRPYTTNPSYKVLLTSEADDKLQPLRDKCWFQLDWLNMNTSGGLRHVRQKFNNNETKRASKVSRDGMEWGWMSEINTIVADNPNKVRGTRVDRLIFEEAGSAKNLAKAWIQGAALVELGGTHFGTRIALGTGGDEVALEGLSSIFSNPAGFNVLPYKNYDTYDGKPELTAFFLPAHKFALKHTYLDNRGVTNWPLLKEYYQKQREKLSGRDYTNECAEHCFVPEEALAKTGANVFDSEIIAQQMANIKIHNSGINPIPTALEWDDTTPRYTQVISRTSTSSKLLVVEPPLKDPEGKVWKNLYVAGIDSIDMGADNSALDADVSDFCIVIKRRVFGDQEPKYVAIYKDRPRDIRAAYMIALKLLTWYNCQAMLEYTKITFQQFLIDRKKEYFLMSRPEYAVSVKNKKKSNKRLIGIPGTEAVIKHGLELISSFLSDYYYTIDYPEILEELLKYTYENKRKFDIVAAMSCCEIGDEAMTGIMPVKQQQTTSNWQDIGYYKDERGYTRYGAIPKKNIYDQIRTGDPWYH